MSSDEIIDNEDSQNADEDARDAAELLNYAYYYLGLGELEQAGDMALEARDIFEDLQDAGGSAESRWLLGFIKFESGEFKEALPMLASAQQQFSVLGMPRQQCATLYLLAQCHLGIERPNKAVYALNLARSTCDAHKNAPASAGERCAFLPDWETLDRLTRELLERLKGAKAAESA